MREPLARQPGAGDDLDPLLEPRLGLGLRNLESGELVVAIALADAEIEPPAGDEIERRRLFRQQHRIVPRQHHHGGPHAQARSAHRQASEQHQRRRDLIPTGEMVLDQEARMKPERLGFDVEIEIVAEALSGFRWQIVAVGLRRAEQAETHGLWLISFRPDRPRQSTYLEQQQPLHQRRCIMSSSKQPAPLRTIQRCCVLQQRK